MKLHIEIDMDGAAFDGAGRTAEMDGLLRGISSQLDLCRPDSWLLVDDNGNTCGRAWTTED